MSESLNWIDYIIICIFFLSTLVGLMRGLMRELIAILTWGIALLGASLFASPLAEKITSILHVNEALATATQSMAVDPTKYVSLIALSISFMSIFIGILIIGSVINYLISSAVELAGISIGNRLLGAIFGLLRGFLIIFVLIFFVELSPLSKEAAWTESQFVQAFQGIMTPLMQWVKPFYHEEVATIA